MASTLQQDLKMREPFASVEHEAILSVLRTCDLLEYRIARLLREYGLTSSQYNVLRILRMPMACLEVADRMIQVAPPITRVVEQLLKLDLIYKRQCQDDRRVFYIEIKSAAKRLLKKIDQPLLNLHGKQLANVSRRDLKNLIRTLESVRQQSET